MNTHSRAVEDYLKAVYVLQQDGGPVGTCRLSEHLRLTPASVSAMVKRLADEGLLRHERYRGVRLTPAGERVALRIIRRHRVLELFLAEVLGYGWDRVHEEAERLEHAASDEMVDRLAKVLGDPERDPHGSVIPTREGEVDRAEYPALAGIPPGQAMEVLEVRVHDAERLRYLGSLGICPGSRVEVVRAAPFDGPVSLRVNGEPRVIARAFAECIRVAPVGKVPRRRATLAAGSDSLPDLQVRGGVPGLATVRA